MANPPLGCVDLHTHTTASDGTLAPEALIQKARERGVSVLAITDHDTLDGYLAVRSSAGESLRLIPGIELSVEGPAPCHLLGYFVDPLSKVLQNRLQEFRERRFQRGRAIVERLQHLGVNVTFEQVVTIAAQAPIGRPHIADALVALSVVRNRQQAFDRYLGRGKPAYLQSDGPGARDILDLIRAAGGVASLAHPAYDVTEEQVRDLKEKGLCGLEAYYPDHSRAQVERFLDWTRRYGLVATGGSDFHGPRTRRNRLAAVGVPWETVEALEAARPIC